MSVISLEEMRKKKLQEKKEEPQEKKELSFEELMKINELKKQRVEKQRHEDNNKVTRSYNLKKPSSRKDDK
jgi:hypothetical protein